MAELVAKTKDAVTVTNGLTTLIDWTNIEHFGGDFTLVVENVGGETARPLKKSR